MRASAVQFGPGVALFEDLADFRFIGIRDQRAQLEISAGRSADPDRIMRMFDLAETQGDPDRAAWLRVRTERL